MMLNQHLISHSIRMLELPGTCIEIREKDPAVDGNEEENQGTVIFKSKRTLFLKI